MTDLIFDYDSLLAQSHRREPIEILGMCWVVESVVRHRHPTQGSMLRLRLNAQVRPGDACTGGMIRLVVRETVVQEIGMRHD